jgi:hypothetical protein
MRVPRAGDVESARWRVCAPVRCKCRVRPFELEQRLTCIGRVPRAPRYGNGEACGARRNE